MKRRALININFSYEEIAKGTVLFLLPFLAVLSGDAKKLESSAQGLAYKTSISWIIPFIMIAFFLVAVDALIMYFSRSKRRLITKSILKNVSALSIIAAIIYVMRTDFSLRSSYEEINLAWFYILNSSPFIDSLMPIFIYCIPVGLIVISAPFLERYQAFVIFLFSSLMISKLLPIQKWQELYNMIASGLPMSFGEFPALLRESLFWLPIILILLFPIFYYSKRLNTGPLFLSNRSKALRLAVVYMAITIAIFAGYLVSWLSQQEYIASLSTGAPVDKINTSFQSWWISSSVSIHGIFPGLFFGMLFIFSLALFFRDRSDVLNKKLIQTSERDRINQIAHDRVFNRLSAIALQIELEMKTKVKSKEYLSELPATIRQTVSDLREVVLRVGQNAEDSLSIKSQMINICDQRAKDYRLKIDCDIDLDDKPDLSIQKREALISSLEEGLGNIAKHAKATEVEIKLHSKDGYYFMSIQDNGDGFEQIIDIEKMLEDGHLGLAGMSKRALDLDGKFNIDSTPGKGTTVKLSWRTE